MSAPAGSPAWRAAVAQAWVLCLAYAALADAEPAPPPRRLSLVPASAA